jgi:hypothetical protein
MQQRLTDPRRRAAYRAARDPAGERAQTLKRLQAAHQTYNQLSKLGRKRLRDAAQGATATAPASAGAPSRGELPWLAHLTDIERDAYEATEADARDYYERQGLANAQRRAELEAALDPTGERAQTLARQHVAYEIHNRISARARRRMQRSRQGGAPPREQRAWRVLLSEAERAEYEAARPDALEYLSQGLDSLQRRAEYLAEPDETGQRAKTLERLKAAYNTVGRLSTKGRRRLELAEPGTAQQPDKAPAVDVGDSSLGERKRPKARRIVYVELTADWRHADNESVGEDTSGDADPGGNSRLYRLTRLTTGRSSLGAAMFAHAALSRASEAIRRLVKLVEAIGRYVKPDEFVKSLARAARGSVTTGLSQRRLFSPR